MTRRTSKRRSSRRLRSNARPLCDVCKKRVIRQLCQQHLAGSKSSFACDKQLCNRCAIRDVATGVVRCPTHAKKASNRKARRGLQQNSASKEVTGCVFVQSRASRTIASAALRRSGLHYSYLSSANSDGAPRYMFSGAASHYAAFLAALPAETSGLDIYCD